MSTQIKRVESADRSVVGVILDLGVSYMYCIWVQGLLIHRVRIKDYEAINKAFNLHFKEGL
jgi:hypothetical protein